VPTWAAANTAPKPYPAPHSALPAGRIRIAWHAGRWLTLEPRSRRHNTLTPRVFAHRWPDGQIHPQMAPTADLPTRTYTPASPLAQPGLLWRELVADLWAGRELE
jgi:hypothetical protein